MSNQRFQGKAGEEYQLFKLACSHYDELERVVGEVIAKRYNNSEQKIIGALELGCGPGYTTSVILSADSRIRVKAVDNEPVMISQARTCLDDYVKEGRVELVEQDALIYLQSLEDESVDVFASGFTLHNFNNEYRNQVLNEVYRIMKKGGLFVNADKYARDEEHNEDLQWQLQQFKEKYRAIGRNDLEEEWVRHYLEDNNPEILMNEKESLNGMQEMGFKEIRGVYRQHMEAVVVAAK
tara:strand:+ start:1570 stop:2283 length:714 start_codon:yes stop_codon:yes gene_type:complete